LTITPRRRRTRIIPATLLAAAALLGSVGTHAALAQAVPTPSAQGSTTVIDPGKEPRVVLSYRPTQGWTSDYEIIIRGTPRVIIDGKEPPVATGAMIILPVNITVLQTTDISFILMCTVGRPAVAPRDGVTPEQARQLETRLAGAEGGRFALEFTTRGEVARSELLNAGEIEERGRDMLRNMLSMLSASLVPVPAELIGAGAKVTIAQPVKAEGVDLALTQELSFPRLLPSGAQMRANLSTVMAPMQAGVDGKPESVAITGDVTTEILLGRPLPTFVSARTTRSIGRSIKEGDKVQSLRTLMTTEFVLRELRPTPEIRNPGEPPADSGQPR
jgi:hypothetical protein